jgi:hypothetical protein
MRLMARRAALRRESITSQALKETFQKCDRQTQSQTERSNLKRKLLKAWLFVTTNVELRVTGVLILTPQRQSRR